MFKSKGIVLRTIKYGETSVITDIFTREKGLRSYIVNGVRKSKPKFNQSLFQIMSQVEILAYDHQSKNLNRIKEIRPAFHYTEIPFNILKSSIGIFMTELCQKSIKEKEPNPDLYDFLASWFGYLDTADHHIANLHIGFMVEFSAKLGFQPMDNYDESSHAFFALQEGYFTSSMIGGGYFMDEESSKLLHIFINTPKEELSKIQLSRKSRTILLNQLVMFYQLHIENFPKLNSVDVLSEVLN